MGQMTIRPTMSTRRCSPAVGVGHRLHQTLHGRLRSHQLDLRLRDVRSVGSPRPRPVRTGWFVESLRRSRFVIFVIEPVAYRSGAAVPAVRYCWLRRSGRHRADVHAVRKPARLPPAASTTILVVLVITYPARRPRSTFYAGVPEAPRPCGPRIRVHRRARLRGGVHDPAAGDRAAADVHPVHFRSGHPGAQSKSRELALPRGVELLVCDPDDDHTPAFVVDRIGPVDLERDATILRGVQLGAGIRPEDDSAPRERIVDRKIKGWSSTTTARRRGGARRATVRTRRCRSARDRCAPHSWQRRHDAAAVISSGCSRTAAAFASGPRRDRGRRASRSPRLRRSTNVR